MTTTTTIKSVFTVWDAVHEIAIMLDEEGYTSTEVRAAADTLRRIKAELWEAERFTDKDSTKLLGTNIWVLDHAADEMDRIFGTTLMSDEAEDDIASDIEWAIEEMWTNLPSIYEKHECFDAEDYYENTDTDENDDFMWDEMEQEETHGALFDGDLGQLLGDWEWQYDTDAIVDMITVYDPATCQTYHKLEDDMPDIDEIDEATMWAPIAENIEHIMEWYNSRSDIEICDVDDEMVLDALTETDDDGHLVWKPMTCSQVESVIYDLALLTSDNMGTSLAEDICDERLDEMWEVIAWAGATPLDLGDDEELGLGRIWYSLTEPHGVWDTPDWKHMTREQTYDAIKAIVG